jgi:cob(I)alamin adenosyltransferase
MAIYTKTGDKGRTSLGSGLRVWKDSLRVESYGTIDELNALLGVIELELSLVNKKYAKYLSEIIITVQNDLFCIGSYLSNPANSSLISGLSENTLMFESQIDEMTALLPELENFILPGGGRIGANLQLARAVSRRAERKLVSLIKKEKVNSDVVSYINRLSDLFFTMSRFANFNEKKKEIIWKKR